MNREKAIQSIDAIIAALNDLKAALSEECPVKADAAPAPAPAPEVKPAAPAPEVKTAAPAAEAPEQKRPIPVLQEPNIPPKPSQDDITLVMPEPSPEPVISTPVPEPESITLVMPEPILERDTAKPASRPAANAGLVMPESYSMHKNEIPEQYQKQEKPIHLVLPDQVAPAAKPVRPETPAVSPEASGMICPKCQSLVPEGSKFCDICGTPIRPFQEAQTPKRKFCSKCGTEALPTDRFCMKCGSRLD